MTEETKIFTLQSGLSPSLKEDIRFWDEPEEMVEFVKLLKKADCKMQSYQAQNSGRRPQQTPVLPSRPPLARPERRPLPMPPTPLEE
ncbi:hypothetical protein Q9L58_010202 [Maublancomyces gigas]|uniref:Uncharacterized protein n=1 Tax=Discina gigas TaxID=1032678 RepID=A0ABR3G4S6_9PEZI